MPAASECGKILVSKRGAWCCPGCGSRLITKSPGAEAKNMPVYCHKCRRDFYVNIVSGLCYESPRPISPSGE